MRKLRPATTFPAPVLATGALVGIGLAVAIPFIVEPAYVNQYTTGLGFAVVLISLGLLLWTSGQISLCQMAFAAIGASTFGHAIAAGWPWLAALAAPSSSPWSPGARRHPLVPPVRHLPRRRHVRIWAPAAEPDLSDVPHVRPVRLRQRPRPQLLGINATSDRAYYFVALVVAALCALGVIGLRRSRLGRLLRGMSDSPLALEAHGANTRLTRLYVFGVAAGLAAVGGVLIAGVTQSAGGTPTGPFGYFNSVVILAVLAICGSQPFSRR